MKIERVAVLGAGTMGIGIATALVMAGRQVRLIDAFPAVLSAAPARILGNLTKAAEKGLIKVAPADAMKLLSISPEFNVMGDCELVIEAVSENPDVKAKVFGELNSHAKADAIIASNTSALRISDFARGYKRPERVLGMHFFNPAHILKLVELVRCEATDAEVYATAKAFISEIGKEPVEVKESYGFIVNRILIPVINEAAMIFGEGIATAADIDTAMKLGASHPMGPLALGDLVGLDVCLAIMQTLEKQLDARKFAPAEALVKLVKEGKLGRKTGEGFHKYEAKK